MAAYGVRSAANPGDLGISACIIWKWMECVREVAAVDFGSVEGLHVASDIRVGSAGLLADPAAEQVSGAVLDT